MKIAIASEAESLDSQVCPVFGRAPYYLFFEGEKLVKTIKNPFATGGGGAGFGVAQMLSNEGVELVVCGKLGGNAAGALEEKKIRHKAMQGETIFSALEKI
ncbi:hypothetical protein COU37_01515 [Candidatus Micrarchaeota archaeon CG10_big_fil_rev_8_21_14_0_10_45_29]|nr:MAG: hypothetical protein COU37_01515 [Candidatus Micrarchaeota archaeon CG10_big_fil_rev_8_21_14_0_10_45_29]